MRAWEPPADTVTALCWTLPTSTQIMDVHSSAAQPVRVSAPSGPGFQTTVLEAPVVRSVKDLAASRMTILPAPS